MKNNFIEMSDVKGARTSVLKEYFSLYLTEVRGLRESSVGHYFDALNNISKRLKEKKLVEHDVYEIMDLDYLATVRDILYQDTEFLELNERGRRMYSSGFNNYYRFASGEEFIGSIEKMSKLDIPIAPEEPLTIEQVIWKRSNIIRIQAITFAGFACEIDQSHISFIAKNTHKPYMEGHHAIPMKLQKKFDHSLDVYANIVCLCPVCHRRIHYGLESERSQLIDLIYAERADRLANSGIRLSSQEFSRLLLSQ